MAEVGTRSVIVGELHPSGRGREELCPCVSTATVLLSELLTLFIQQVCYPGMVLFCLLSLRIVLLAIKKTS